MKLAHYNYAVIQNNKVVDVIVAESKELAESLTNSVCIGYDLADHTSPQPGWDYIDNKFYPTKPHKSLTKWNQELFCREPGVDYPEDGKPYTWNLETESWEELEVDPNSASMI